MSTAILKKNVKKQKNITAPEPAVVSAPRKRLIPCFELQTLPAHSACCDH